MEHLPRFGKGSVKTLAVDTAYYIAGSVLNALGLYTFALNAGFATGGVSGLALIVNNFTGWPIGLLTLAFNVPIILVCARVVGTAFIAKTVYTMLWNTLLLDVVFPLLPTYKGDALLAAMFTGVTMGAGLALIYMRGSSTGGTDFITMTVKKLRPHFSVGQISLSVDMVVILGGGLAFGNVNAVLYGIVCSFAATYTMDNLLYGAGSSKMALIITTKGQQIANAISAEVERGSTLLQATGAYTGEGRQMLLSVCSKREIYKVRTAARAIDPGALIMITEASEVFGEGFSRPALPGSEDVAAGRPAPVPLPPGEKENPEGP